MKKFFYQSLIFLLPVFIISLMIEISLREIPNVYQYKRSYLDKNSSEIEVLCLGSSHAYYGINPSYFKERSFNASHISQSLDYDLEILKKYDNHWEKLKCIVLPISYFTLFQRLETSVESWRTINYDIYYGLKPWFNPGSLEFLHNKSKIIYKRLRSYYVKGQKPFSCSTLGWGADYDSRKGINLEVTGKNAALKHTAARDNHYSENVIIIDSIIEIAKKRNLKILFFTPPAYQTYTCHLDQQQLYKTTSTIEKIDFQNVNVNYVNLINDDAFTRPDFFDADHLNEKGARKLSLKIDSLLNLQGSIKSRERPVLQR